MSEEAITIDIEGVAHDLTSLPVETQKQVQRIAMLRQRAEALTTELQELNLVIDTYQNTVVQSVKPVENDAAANE